MNLTQNDGKFLDIQMSPPDSSPKKVVFIMRDQIHLQRLERPEEGERSPMFIPHVVDDIETKVLAFKVKVQPNNKCCSKIQVLEDSQLIACLLDRTIPYMILFGTSSCTQTTLHFHLLLVWYILMHSNYTSFPSSFGPNQ
ncbi:hypothetical protein Lal_00022359 [Lupinus albus]|nr:hypothetical protein Lal_00022359 [Lupinus albus]